MRRLLMISGLILVVAASGCEWSSSGDGGTTWSDEYNWLNFSGTYRAPDGGVAACRIPRTRSRSRNKQE